MCKLNDRSSIQHNLPVFNFRWEGMKQPLGSESCIIDKHLNLVALLCDCRIDFCGCLRITEIGNYDISFDLGLLLDLRGQSL